MVRTIAPYAQDLPPPVFGHCCCVVGDTLFAFGGRQGHRLSQKLYTLDTGARSPHMPSMLPCPFDTVQPLLCARERANEVHLIMG